MYTSIDEAAEAWDDAAHCVAEAIQRARDAGVPVPSEIGGRLLTDPVHSLASVGVPVRGIAYSNGLRDPRPLLAAYRTLAAWVHDAIANGLTDAHLTARAPDGETVSALIAALVRRQRNLSLAVLEIASDGRTGR